MNKRNKYGHPLLEKDINELWTSIVRKEKLLSPKLIRTPIKW